MEGKTESQMTSAAAFVEGGIQDSCDDACSICLEEFSSSDPSSVTNCKHEFHLQCILEWCQRSSQCPMCCQPISLKDPTSQELFKAVEQERCLRVTPSRNTAIFHHPAFGGFELQHLRMSVGDADFEERFIQHLATAAAMRRANQLGLREGQRTRSSPHGGENEPAAITNRSPSNQITSDGYESSQQTLHLQTQSSQASRSTVIATNRGGIYSNDRGSTAHSSPANKDRAGPSELQSFSDSLRSRLSSVSMKYKESISKGARGWRERLFCRSCSMPIDSENREVNAGIASVSGLMDSRETTENNRVVGIALSNHMMGRIGNHNNVEASGENSSHDDNTRAACSASLH